LLNAAFAMAILDLISHVHLPSFVNNGKIYEGKSAPVCAKNVDGGEWSTSRFGGFNGGTESRYLLGGYQSPVGRFREEKNILPLQGFKSWMRPANSLVANPGCKPNTSTDKLRCDENFVLNRGLDVWELRHVTSSQTVI
jgi:hypothetical protein